MTWLGISPQAVADDDLVFGHDLDRVGVGDVDDAAAHGLTVGQLDQELVNRPPP
jgi:hypothetical protein